MGTKDAWKSFVGWAKARSVAYEWWAKPVPGSDRGSPARRPSPLWRLAHHSRSNNDFAHPTLLRRERCSSEISLAAALISDPHPAAFASLRSACGGHPPPAGEGLEQADTNRFHIALTASAARGCLAAVCTLLLSLPRRGRVAVRRTAG